MRIEDIDPPRAQSGAVPSILLALERYGFAWDGPVIYQSRNRARHDEILAALVADGLAYPCGCSRKDMDDALQGDLGTIYPGTCRNGTRATETALRLRTDNDEIVFNDAVQGKQAQRLESESGDFIIRRKDGLTAYQLAVVVDDYLQGITDVVRGIDLMDSTPRQIYLQRRLGFLTPRYAHIPVAVNDRNQKLSKSRGANGIPLDQAPETLRAALDALRQRPPKALKDATPAEIWSWAFDNWDLDQLRDVKALPSPAAFYAKGEADLPKNA